MFKFTEKRQDNWAKARQALSSTLFKCEFCDKELTKSNLKKHTEGCKHNPQNQSVCPVCGKIFYCKWSSTCSHACSNTYFRSGENNPNYRGTNYSKICFTFHKKECVVCGEWRIVEVHHLDHNKKNNDPRNLIPLCSNHHRYWHSRFKYLVEEKVLTYAAAFAKTYREK